MSIQYLAHTQRAYQAAYREYLEYQRGVQEGRIDPEGLKEKWSEVEEAAAEVADARWDYEEVLAGEL
jgi:5'-deoxynucleotidase YfbR-like HD superfamily hydrolase